MICPFTSRRRSKRCMSLYGLSRKHVLPLYRPKTMHRTHPHSCFTLTPLGVLWATACLWYGLADVAYHSGEWADLRAILTASLGGEADLGYPRCLSAIEACRGYGFALAFLYDANLRSVSKFWC